MFYVDSIRLNETIEFLQSERRKIQRLEEQIEQLMDNALPEQRRQLKEAAAKLERTACAIWGVIQALQRLQEQMEQYRRETSRKLELIQRQAAKLFEAERSFSLEQ